MQAGINIYRELIPELLSERSLDSVGGAGRRSLLKSLHICLGLYAARGSAIGGASRVVPREFPLVPEYYIRMRGFLYLKEDKIL